MANPTTYFGWVMPTSTDLVTDLPADFNVFGQGVDTSMQDLLGGTTGQVLSKTSATNMDFTWVTPSSGMTLISQTVASAQSGIDFTSISGSYKQLLLVWSGIIHSAGSSTFVLRCNADSGNNYARREAYISTTNAVAALADTSNFGTSMFGNDTTDAGIVNNSAGQILIDNYSSATKFKTFLAEYGYNDSGTNFFQYVSQGTYKSTTAITQLNIVRTAGAATISNATDTTIRLYGIS
jgi:hypothetical protein